jgi:glycosyltransferase involved in cell wall biosynthesis
MLISVVVPTHNRGRGLSACLQALQTQDYPTYEIILSDDGSTDNTAEVVARYPRIKYIKHENRGPAAARNRGIEQARGEIVAFTDDDCRVPTDWLSRLVDGFQRYPEVAGVGGFLDPPDEVVTHSLFARYERFTSFNLYRQSQMEMVGGLEDYPGGGTSNIAYHKTVLDQLGGFDEWFPYPAAEDHDLRVRVHQLGYKLLYLPLRVEHLRTYSWQGFRRQNITHGRGVIRWEYKSNQRLTSYTRIGLRMSKRTLQIIPFLVTFRDKRLALVHWLGICFDAYGQFLERRQLSSQ